MRSFAYVALLFGDSVDVFLGLVVLGYTLRVRHQTKHSLVLMHTKDVPERFRRVLSQFWTLGLVDDIPVDESRVSSPQEKAKVDRLRKLFLKLRALELTEFEKVLYLDSDILVRRPLDYLFELPAPAGVEVTRPPVPTGQSINSSRLLDPETQQQVGRINAGVLLLAPSQRTFGELAKQAAACGRASFCPEEDLMTCFWASSESSQMWTSLGVEHNMEMWRGYDASVETIENAAVFHFSCNWAKPGWVVQKLFQQCSTARSCKDETSIFAISQKWIQEYPEWRDPNDLLAVATCEWAEELSACANWCRGREAGFDIFDCVARCSWEEEN